MKYHLVTWDHHTVAFTSQKDAMTLMGLLVKALKLTPDYSQGYDREIWKREPIGEVKIRQLDFREAPAEKPLRTARGRALPAPPAALQLGFSLDPDDRSDGAAVRVKGGWPE